MGMHSETHDRRKLVVVESRGWEVFVRENVTVTTPADEAGIRLLRPGEQMSSPVAHVNDLVAAVSASFT